LGVPEILMTRILPDGHHGHSLLAKTKAASFRWRLKNLAEFWGNIKTNCGGQECPPYTSLPTFVEQHAFGFFCIHWTVVQFVRLEEDLDEGRTGRDCALDQGFRQRVFNVLLQGAA
jgi:hypothetical protein